MNASLLNNVRDSILIHFLEFLSALSVEVLEALLKLRVILGINREH